MTQDSLPPPVTARPITTLRYAAATPMAALEIELPTISNRDAWLDLALLMLVTLIVPFGSQIVMIAASGLPLDERLADLKMDPMMLVVQKWFDLLLVSGLAAYLLMHHRLRPAAFGLTFRPVGTQTLWTLATGGGIIAAWIGTAIVVFLLTLVIPSFQKDAMDRMRMLDAMPTGSIWIGALLLVPVAAHEELMFRALLLPYLRRIGCTWPWAIVISAVVFALLHASYGWLAVLQISALGIVFALSFVLSRSIFPAIIIHFLFNFGQFQFISRVLPYLQKLAKSAESGSGG